MSGLIIGSAVFYAASAVLSKYIITNAICKQNSEIKKMKLLQLDGIIESICVVGGLALGLSGAYFDSWALPIAIGVPLIFAGCQNLGLRSFVAWVHTPSSTSTGPLIRRGEE